ncbi:hypothetical protein NKH77_20535 [Streptomyces sp. M19]
MATGRAGQREPDAAGVAGGPVGTDAEGDHLEEALGRALRLLESAVHHHRRSALAGVTSELPVDGEAVAGWVARLVLRAEREVLWALPRWPPRSTRG